MLWLLGIEQYTSYAAVADGKTSNTVTHPRGVGGTNRLVVRANLLATKDMSDGVSAKHCFPAGINRGVRQWNHVCRRKAVVTYILGLCWSSKSIHISLNILGHNPHQDPASTSPSPPAKEHQSFRRSNGNKTRIARAIAERFMKTSRGNLGYASMAWKRKRPRIFLALHLMRGMK